MSRLLMFIYRITCIHFFYRFDFFFHFSGSLHLDLCLFFSDVQNGLINIRSVQKHEQSFYKKWPLNMIILCNSKLW